MSVFIAITDKALSLSEAEAFVSAAHCGGTDLFFGTVRNHHDSKLVLSLEYEAYPEMAEKKLKEFAEEAKLRFKVEKIYCVHRIGHLIIGEKSILIATSAPHRDACFKATRFMIEKIKLDLPVWKKEHYQDAPAEWLKACSHSDFKWESLL